MKHHNLIDDLLSSRSLTGLLSQLRGYLKWIIIGAVIMFILGFILITVLIIGLFNMLFRTTSEQLPSWQNQSQSIFTEGQRWWEQRFNQEQQQLESIQLQLEQLQQQLDEQNPTSVQEN